MKRSLILLTIITVQFAFAQGASAFDLSRLFERFGSSGTATFGQAQQAAEDEGIGIGDIPNVRQVGSVDPEQEFSWRQTQPRRSCLKTTNIACLEDALAYLNGDPNVAPECQELAEQYAECKGVDPNDPDQTAELLDRIQDSIRPVN